jgi:hypothetical protein
MNKSQSMTWELLLILGIVLLLISPVGEWLGSIVGLINTHHDVSLNFNPLNPGTTKFQNTTGTTTSSGVTNNSSGPQLFNVPIVDASGGAGTIQVVASNASSALQNATQGGNKPTGNAVAA